MLALRRNAGKVPAPLTRPRRVDLTRETPDLGDLQARFVVVALTARPRTEESYRSTYVDGMRRALDALAATGSPLERAVLVSSTAVHGSSERPALEDETTPARPGDGPGRMLLAAEELFLERLPNGTVLRLSGLYGGSSTRLLDQVREGRIEDPHRWTNRIHREDAAAAVVHLLTRPSRPSASTSAPTTSRRSWATWRPSSRRGSTPRHRRRPTPRRVTASGSPTPACGRRAGSRAGRAIARATS